MQIDEKKNVLFIPYEYKNCLILKDYHTLYDKKGNQIIKSLL